MNKFAAVLSVVLLSTGAAFSQTASERDKIPPVVEIQDNSGRTRETKPVQYDNAATGSTDVVKRGAEIGTEKKVALAKIMKNPAKYAGKTVLVEGVIVRSCKMEGCWMELAPSKGAPSVRVRMKDHAFFIPLDAAGMNAKAEGVFSVKTLSKKEVEHLMNEDGAKFDKINKDGSVTEISFEAIGVELSK